MASLENHRAALAGGQDRLSELPDGVLGDILSFLPNKEAARAALLSRRWRHIFGDVHTISFGEEEGERDGDWSSYYYDVEEKRSCSWRMIDDLGSALLCRHRCGGLDTPLRSFRFAFDNLCGWDEHIVNQWLFNVLRQRHSHQELRLDLCFLLGDRCPRFRYDDDDGKEPGPKYLDSDSDSGDSDDSYRYRPYQYERRRNTWIYMLPRLLFSCAALRTLRLRYCLLEPPEAINLPHVEELHLTSIQDSWPAIKRLITSCPRLADLTLETCPQVTSVSVLDRRLRRFSLRCCHKAASVCIDATELRVFDYKGAAPAVSLSLLTLHGSPAITSCSIDICGRNLTKDVKFVRLRNFLQRFADARRLHLQSIRLGACLETELFAGFPALLKLRRLELQGCHERCSAVYAVRRILEQTPNLEVLSLYMEPVPEENCSRRRYEEDGLNQREGGRDDEQNDFWPDPSFLAPAESSFELPCLRRRVRDIHMVHYRGNKAQRLIARMLFRNALVLERLCVVFQEGPLPLQDELANEIKTWAVDKSEKVFM